MKHFLSLPDMCCAVEGNEAKAVLEKLEGVTRVTFNTMNRTVSVEGDIDEASLLNALARNGITARALSQDKALGTPEPARIPYARLGTALILALAAEISEIVGASILIVIAMSLAAVLLAGFSTFTSGVKSAFSGRLNMEVLMTVAVIGAVAIGHYPEAAMVMTLFEISEAIEALSVSRANGAVFELLKMPDRPVLVLNDAGQFEEMPQEAVAQGSIIRVLEGDYVALDGVVQTGAAAIDESMITGEALPKDKTTGDAVWAGSVCVSGEVRVLVTHDSAHSTVAKMLEAVRLASENKSGLERFVDRFASVYTPAVFFFAILTVAFFAFGVGESFSQALYKGLILLVIACPCALVISTPVTVVSALTAAAKMGAIIKGGAFIEGISRLQYLAFDKTGTVTTGRPSVKKVLVSSFARETQAVQIASGFSQHSRHPVSLAISRFAKDLGVEAMKLESYELIAGTGFKGTLGNVSLYLESLKAFKCRHAIPESLRADIEAFEAEGMSFLVLSDDLGAIAVFVIGDTIKAEAPEALTSLRHLGLTAVMMTGDGARSAAKVAKTLGITEVFAEQMPEDKLARITELKRLGPVGMVGDGTNDSPALAGADVSFTASENATAIALEAADVVLIHPDLRIIASLVRLARLMRRKIIENITFALSIKALFAVLTFTGLTNMWLAVFADIGVCLIVVAWGMSVLKFKG